MDTEPPVPRDKAKKTNQTSHGKPLEGWRVALSRRSGALGIALLLCFLAGDPTRILTQAAHSQTLEPVPLPPVFEALPAAPLTPGGGWQFASALYDSTGLENEQIVDLPATTTEVIADMVIDWSGRTVVAGWAVAGGTRQFLVGRFVAGELDPEFGDGGIALTDFTLGDDESAFAVAIDDDKNIVAGGGVSQGGKLRFALSRYRVGGKLDTWSGFGGGDGKQITDIGSSEHESITDIAIDSENRIIAAGWAYVGGHYQIALARYRSNGALDQTFGNGGIVLTELYGMADSAAVAVGLLNRRRIVVAAQAGDVDGVREVALVLYDATDGQRVSWTTLHTEDNHESMRVADMDLSYPGAIVVAGAVEHVIHGTSRFFVGRSDINWSKAFGINGVMIVDFPESEWEEAVAVSVNETTGSIVAAGWAEVNTGTGYESRFAVAKLSFDGAPITAFAGDGRLLTDLPTANERIHAACIYTHEPTGEEYVLTAGVARSSD